MLDLYVDLIYKSTYFNLQPISTYSKQPKISTYTLVYMAYHWHNTEKINSRHSTKPQRNNYRTIKSFL